MQKKDKLLNEISSIRSSLKAKVREKWSKSERLEIKRRGEEDADFYLVWYKLCMLGNIEQWINKYGNITRSQRGILNTYKRGVI